MSSQILTNYNVDDGVNRFQTSNPVGLEDILKNLGPELALLEENIIRDIQTDVELLNTVSQHILLAGGKRLRPALVLLASAKIAIIFIPFIYKELVDTLNVTVEVLGSTLLPIVLMDTAGLE